MKRAIVLLVAGTIFSGVAAVTVSAAPEAGTAAVTAPAAPRG
jgi:TRAP-type mannitol/chloroaromatic compound transport system permease large subunit